ncbi:MAG: DUF308 domain-containing protein [Lachnospiraceae bacterium]|nr:DUF308 domain-containing protein [Lachnospiraceae bacterium]
MDKNKITWVQICWFVAQVVLIISGILALCNPGDKLVSISWYLGFSMLIVGGISLIIFKKKKKNLHGSQWLLADGLSTMLLSLFPLFNQMILPAVIPFFFGVWELFSGILKVIDASELKEELIKGWKWFRSIGCIEILSGVAALLKPIDDFVGMNVIVAIIFFIQSCGFLFKILIYPEIMKEDTVNNEKERN